MAQFIRYSIQIGGKKIDEKSADGDLRLHLLTTALGMGGAGGRCTLEFLGAEGALPKLDDKVVVKLGKDKSVKTVFTGKVSWAEATLSGKRIIATDGLNLLGRSDIEKMYENVNADFIIKDLLKSASLKPGKIEKGPKFPSYVLHREPSALSHLRRLAELCGADIYTDGKGKVYVLAPKSKAADHTLKYDEQVLRFALENNALRYDGAEIVGEGAASSKGAKKYHWLVEKTDSVTDKAKTSGKKVSTGKGKWAHRRVIGALRSKDAATIVGKAAMMQEQQRARSGYAEILGEPGVFPDQWIAIKNLPAKYGLEGVLKGADKIRVKGVQHCLNFHQGFITRLIF